MNSLSNFQIPDVWEVKDVINKMKSVVLNYTEMETKVHEATSNDPWGASSTLMQELAQGTYNYQYFNEIMPAIYRRFTEKESKQWRQIYKALVLLEFLIKNGTERVVDDARSHVSIIKVLRNFYYIDDKGKDEGLNVRNRAKEIVELLSSTDRIRSERKLAKKNRNKYVGVGSDSVGSRGGFNSYGDFTGSSSGSRYTGFGSDSPSGGGGLSFNGDAMSYGESAYPRPSGGGKYDEDDDGLYHSDSNKSSPTSRANTAKDANLFDDDDSDDFGSHSKKNTTSNDDDWGDFAWGGSAEESTTTNKPSVSIDDDFADFQHAVVEEPAVVSKKKDLFDLLGDDSVTATTSATGSNNATAAPSNQFSIFDSQQPMTPSGYQQKQLYQPQPQQTKQQNLIEETPTATVAPTTPTGMWAQASNFVSLDSLGKKANSSTPSSGPSMNSLKSSSVQAGWNNWASNNQQQPAPKPANKTTSAFDDLLL